MNDSSLPILQRSERLLWPGSDRPWQETWFNLAAERKKQSNPVLAFWQVIAQACITRLCHCAQPTEETPDDLEKIASIPLPDAAQDWLISAPPLPGGEFLSLDMLHSLWRKLLLWCSATLSPERTLATFLAEQAPHFSHVGHVFFHLAENKMDKVHPFAFLATYATGLNERGDVRHMPLSQAVRLYAKAGKKDAVLHLLAPLVEATKRLPWVSSMVADKSIYQPRSWTPKEAYTFLQSASDLDECGIGVRTPNWWQKRPRTRVKAVFNTRNARLGAAALVSIDLKVAMGSSEVSVAELTRMLAREESGLLFFKGEWIEFDKEKVEQALSFWKVAEQKALDGDISFAQSLHLLAGMPEKRGDSEEEEEIRSWSQLEPGKGFSDLLFAARASQAIVSIPKLHATLRPYQMEGVNWLSFLGSIGLGACLADDMGLGKTIQILSLLLRDRKGGSNLLIAPASLLANWQEEAARFAPDLSLLSLHGKSKKALEAYTGDDAFAEYDLVLVSYAGLVRAPWLRQYPWKRVIADEAQAIKNPSSKQSKAVRAVQSGIRIALTGTPVENSLTDLWSLFDFLNPGLLGNSREFQALIKELEKREERFAPLRRLTSPYILRRMKTDKSVLDSLPEKTEMPLYCHLTEAQGKAYLHVTEALKKSLRSVGKSSSEQAKRRMIVLQSLMLLKQICNHPDQAQHGGSYAPVDSGKFARVAEVCETIASRQEKVLIFTQFQEICAPLEAFLQDIFGTPGLVLHGSIPVKERQRIVNAFQTPEGPPFLVLTLKVGGTGLTLTEANHVIHFDRWWNPAVENQATDRAFRIGQKKNVLVHKCITKGTLEERIDQLIADKQALAGEILGDAGEINIASLSDEEIYSLISLDVSSISTEKD